MQLFEAGGQNFSESLRISHFKPLKALVLHLIVIHVSSGSLRCSVLAKERCRPPFWEVNWNFKLLVRFRA